MEEGLLLIAFLVNWCASLNANRDECSWLGFYLLEQNELILGPFQGHPACVHIPIGKGVCGTAVSERRTQIVADVHQFEGHIACDANSKSEIVVPIFKDDKIIGVLDIDAPITDRFDDNDKEHLEAIVKIIEKQLA